MPRATHNPNRLRSLVTTEYADQTTIWIDPGESTGWALWTSDGTFASGQDAAYYVENELYQLLMAAAPRVEVGWEQYVIIGGSRLRHDGSALRVIGFLEWVTRYAGCRLLKPVPSSARNLGQDGAKLQSLGWHVPGRRDANAAAAHLLAYLLREGLLPQHLLRKLVDGSLDG